jgi:hypothetical protein
MCNSAKCRDAAGSRIGSSRVANITAHIAQFLIFITPNEIAKLFVL